MRRRVLRDALIFTPQGRMEGDLLIEGDRIAEVGKVTGKADEEVGLNGLWLWPGAIDAHVHFRDPGLTSKEDFRSGSEAAVSGGVTMVFDMPNTKPATVSVEELEAKRAEISSKTLCNFGLFFGANPDNLEEILAAENIPALKIFMADSTGDLLVDRIEDQEAIFRHYQGRISVHAESQERMDVRRKLYANRDDAAVHSVIRDDETAAQGVARAVALTARYGRRLHVLHLSTRAELEAIRAGREILEEGGGAGRITCEACPHHLFLDTGDYAQWGTRVQMNPPLRDPADREALWVALKAGEVDMVATDHAPHLPGEKARPYRRAPSGVPGVELMLPLMLDAALQGRCSPEEVLRWVATEPARIYGVVDRGAIQVGNFADLVVLDPLLAREVRDQDQRSRCGWTPYAGRELSGWPRMTFVNGQEVFRRVDGGAGEIVAEGPVGREVTFLP